MLIKQIFKTFAQPPMLIEHQLRVAAVGFLILNSLNIKNDDAVKALLVHDLGNIVRIRVGSFNEDYGKAGISYYQDKQKEFINKYGNIDHDVTVKMLSEIGVPRKIIELVKLVKWENILSAVRSKDIVLKILNYADMRVGPLGILPASIRIDEVNKRKTSWPEYDLIKENVIILEGQIFEGSIVKPEDINDDSIKNIMLMLKSWDI